ncbi:hypothetical protein P152DRAFT_455002 [Eremomyces bilateralis CBS 781.70]|uniref:Uncharacterized protein n=1 Tax=Eremomyces bilateralis CBS 781.70 TaxID=1392243 RepID=A0A6G1GFS0_9PEZI|nr:uncharacterized protein P152DRAFT_455002 [Eremomyces bilateralis CBS 781.70]KAF1816761.1 hypothetical protein P152DRAFT_455002 [Eremomyces bilateralis CBS 781.70]
MRFCMKRYKVETSQPEPLKSGDKAGMACICLNSHPGWNYVAFPPLTREGDVPSRHNEDEPGADEGEQQDDEHSERQDGNRTSRELSPKPLDISEALSSIRSSPPPVTLEPPLAGKGDKKKKSTKKPRAVS